MCSTMCYLFFLDNLSLWELWKGLCYCIQSNILWSAWLCAKLTVIVLLWTRGVLTSGFRLFDRIQIVLWTIRPNTNSVAGRAFWCCTCCYDIFHLLMSLANYGHACMLSSHDPLPFIRQAVGAIPAGTDWVKSAIGVTCCTLHYTCTD